VTWELCICLLAGAVVPAKRQEPYFYLHWTGRNFFGSLDTGHELRVDA
jgi:hypothetical protein